MSAPCRITWLLEFTDPNLEASWRQYRLARTHLASDTVVLSVNAVANATMLLRLRMLADLPVSSRLGLLAHLLLSVAHALLVRNAPGLYMQWRTVLVSIARVLRVLVVLSMSSLTMSQPTSWVAMALQLIMLSPASASFLCAVALPLPLRSHLLLQAVVTGIALTRVNQLCQQLPSCMPSAQCGVLELLSARVQLLNPFNMHVLPTTCPDGQDCCAAVLAAVMVACGMVFSSLAVYSIDLVSRTSFLRQASQLPTSSVVLLVQVMRATWLVSCLTALSTLPIIWEVSMLYRQLVDQGLMSLGVVGLGAALTSLLLESFMRCWLALVLLLISSACLVWTRE